MSDRPNIILLMADQQKASATGCYGNPLVQTPTWDRLASEGVLFEHAYSPSPICTPSRTSMMTGTSPLVHQVYCHQNHAPPNVRQLPEFLAEVGYRCVGAGHYESDRSLTRGWTDQIEMLGTERLRTALYAHYQGSRKVGWSSGEHHLPPEQSHAAVLNDEVIELLDTVPPSDGPLFLHVAYIEPHPPYVAPQGHGATVDLDAIPVPARGEPGMVPPWQAQALKNYGTAEATDDDIRRVIAAYYGLIAYADDQIGRLLTYLDRRGFLDNAWVILTSDHGDYTGEKGLFTKTETPYECLLHVPLIVCGPAGTTSAGRRLAQLVELTDLFPSILAMAGHEVPAYTEGRSLLPLLTGDETPIHDAVFSAVGEYHGDLKTTMPWGLPHAGRHAGLVRGARNHAYAYIRDPDYGDEAYDLRTDPLELSNLLRDDASPPPKGVGDLKRAMDAWEVRGHALRTELAVIPGARNFDEKLNPRLTRQEADS